MLIQDLKMLIKVLMDMVLANTNAHTTPIYPKNACPSVGTGSASNAIMNIMYLILRFNYYR